MNKIKITIPLITKIYIILFSITTITLCIMVFLKLFMGINIMHPYNLTLGLIGSLGLLITALASIRDWKEFIKNKNEELKK